jgi:hypothetical protein
MEIAFLGMALVFAATIGPLLWSHRRTLRK